MFLTQPIPDWSQIDPRLIPDSLLPLWEDGGARGSLNSCPVPSHCCPWSRAGSRCPCRESRERNREDVLEFGCLLSHPTSLQDPYSFWKCFLQELPVEGNEPLQWGSIRNTEMGFFYVFQGSPVRKMRSHRFRIFPQIVCSAPAWWEHHRVIISSGPEGEVSQRLYRKEHNSLKYAQLKPGIFVLLNSAPKYSG